MTATVLTDEQVESFIAYGHVTIPDPGHRSPVTAAREGVLPERVLRQRRLQEEEQVRLAEASS